VHVSKGIAEVRSGLPGERYPFLGDIHPTTSKFVLDLGQDP
jgi:hypothetical protein